MTRLIALEFNHTLQYVVARHQSIIQTKVVILIALLALARKLIILDLKPMTRRPRNLRTAKNLRDRPIHWYGMLYGKRSQPAA